MIGRWPMAGLCSRQIRPRTSRSSQQAGSTHLIVRPAPEVKGLLNGVASTTSEARCEALTPMGGAAIDAVTVAADRSRTLTNSGGRDLMRVLFEGVVYDQGVAP